MSSINAMDLNTFLTIFVMTFAVFLLIAGIFTAYFGSGKSRKIGGGLLVFGVILGGVWILISTKFGSDMLGMDPMISLEPAFMTVILQTIVVILAAAIGAGAAIGMFLAAIMKA